WLEANGSSATIGYQNPSGSVWYVLHYGADAVAFPGGLENRSFRMDAGVASSVTLHPTATGVYPVCAEVAGYRTCEVLEVGVLSPYRQTPDSIEPRGPVVARRPGLRRSGSPRLNVCRGRTARRAGGSSGEDDVDLGVEEIALGVAEQDLLQT